MGNFCQCLELGSKIAGSKKSWTEIGEGLSSEERANEMGLTSLPSKQDQDGIPHIPEEGRLARFLLIPPFKGQGKICQPLVKGAMMRTQSC